MIYNRIPVVFGNLRKITIPPVSFQYDIVQKLIISGLELPEYYQVDFCNDGDTSTITMVGTADGVDIPDQFLQTGKTVKAYLVLTGTDEGAVETRYEITIPVNKRPTRTDIEPTPVEQSTIDSLIAAMNDAVDDAEASATAAEGFAENAEASAERAEQAAQSIDDKVTRAEAAAQTAETAATNAEDAKDAANLFASNAAESAEAAHLSEVSAEGSASTATTKAAEASQSASEAAASAASVEGNVQEAEQAAQQAKASADAAEQSATAAQGSATAADGSATVATNKAAEASASATTATEKATEAANSATAAQTAQTGAEAAQAAAEAVLESIPADYGQLSDDVSELKNAIDDVSANKPTYGLSDIDASWTVGGALQNGTINTSYTSYHYSQKISVLAGDAITPVGDTGAYFRWICAYSGTSAISSKGGAGVPYYTVPEGIDGVVVTTPISANVTAVRIVRKNSTSVVPILQNIGHLNWSGNIADGDIIKLPVSCDVTFNVVWQFTGHVGTMGKISLGYVNKDGEFTALCGVDGTYLYYHEASAAAPIITAAHGLSITEDIRIRAEVDLRVNYLKIVSVCSGTAEYKLESSAYFAYTKGAPAIVSDGATLNDCAFSWIPQKISKPIWVFGDSWASMYAGRWPYYMKEAGYADSFLINQYAGEKTITALLSLKYLLNIHRPEYIVWMLGMNDADTATKVNDLWKAAYDELTAICEAANINLILYTVPNTPTIKHNFKNAIVENSGYRYINGVAAVGDNGSGTWFTGYQSSDGNHTTQAGAVALFNRMLADFPEFATLC